MPLHPANQICANCYFYINGSDRPGACAFRAPDPSGSFPSVKPTDWCGKWRNGPPPSEDIQWARVLTDANGDAVFTFPVAYDEPPVVTVSVESDLTLPYVANVTAITDTYAEVHVWQARPLPEDTTPSSLLENYDVFAGADVEGVAVHVVAHPVGV